MHLVSGASLWVRFFVDEKNFVVVVVVVVVEVQLGRVLLFQSIAKGRAAEADIHAHDVNLIRVCKLKLLPPTRKKVAYLFKL